MLKEAYMLAEINLKRASDKQPIKKTKHLQKFQARDPVTLRNYNKQNWDTNYMPNFKICRVISDRACTAIGLLCNNKDAVSYTTLLTA